MIYIINCSECRADYILKTEIILFYKIKNRRSLKEDIKGNYEPYFPKANDTFSYTLTAFLHADRFSIVKLTLFVFEVNRCEFFQYFR